MIPKLVIVHCSDTPDYNIGEKHFDLFGAKEIDLWHKQRKFDRIGYHYVIRRTGVIEKGREENEIGAHCKGYNESIGICYVGKCKPTQEQLISLRKLYEEINLKYLFNIYNWYTHNTFNPGKTCPGFSLSELRDILQDKRKEV